MTLRQFSLLTALLGATALGPVYAQSSAAAPAKASAAKAPPARKPAPGAKPAAAPGAGKPLPPVGGIKPEDRAREMTDKMTQTLGLTIEQSRRVQQINLQSIQRVEEARQTYLKDLARMRTEINLIGTSRLSLLKNVLNEQQFHAYTAMREKKMGIPEALKQQAEAAGGE